MAYFKRVLIANRGEIAVRIIKTLRKLEIESVVLYSNIDNDADFVKEADISFKMDSNNSLDAYLDFHKIVDIAKELNCDGIHPGYGFLSESADFAKACELEGVVFIGPSSLAIRIMGNKNMARDYALKSGLQLPSGVKGSIEEIISKADSLDYPVLIKAAAGGGGKGMRIANSKDELLKSLPIASREALSYFGNGEVYVEKYFNKARHIEVQVLGDHHDNYVHFYERECSIQRRYQKIIEESPSISISEDTRKEICDAAIAICKSIRYYSLGTVEFLMDENEKFYFMEMNTRVQVEHPVTEMVTGFDLIDLQLMVASGKRLNIKQDEILQRGHAIECRVYAEDPLNNFVPSPGDIYFYKAPQTSTDVRIDSSISSPSFVSGDFDPMISKVIAYAEDRVTAIEKMKRVINDYHIYGIETNLYYLKTILKDRDFIDNRISTNYCNEGHNSLIASYNNERKSLPTCIPFLIFSLYSLNKPVSTAQYNNVWHSLKGFKDNSQLKGRVWDEELFLTFFTYQNDFYYLNTHGLDVKAKINTIRDNYIEVVINDHSFKVVVAEQYEGKGCLSLEGLFIPVERCDVLHDELEYLSDDLSNQDSNIVLSPMPGKVIKLNVSEGDKVKKGDLILIVEAMKMENNVYAHCDGVISDLNVKETTLVDANTPLLSITEK
ncbi:MAG: biotin carboxylase N-terminal domain-containing protein [Hyphomicrobiales bacterium]